jgi:LysM repeat protein
MRFIWAIIAGLFLAAGVLLFRSPDAARTSPPASPAPTSDTDVDSPSPVDRISSLASTADVASPEATTATATTAITATASTAAVIEPSSLPEAITPQDQSTPELTHVLVAGDTLQSIARRRYGDERLWRKIVDANPDLAAGKLELGDTIELPPLESIAVVDPAASLIADLDAGRSARPATSTDAKPIEVAPEAPRLDLGLDREILDATVVPGDLVRVADDRFVADGEFTIRGKGTREAPYRVSWELLASAADTYRPSLGERAIPQRIAALDGAWIRIDGYVAFPLGGEEATEILVILNQWDGCCIGVPPTPYDAIEVALTNAVPRSQRHAISFGTLVGRLQVSPYLVENWLVGLYLMDDAEISLEL